MATQGSGTTQLLGVLALGLMLGGCAGKTGADLASEPAAPEQTVEVEAPVAAPAVTPPVAEEPRQPTESPAAAAARAARAADRMRYRVSPDAVPPNPLIDEDFLFRDELSRLIVSDTVTPDPDGPEPLFDVVGAEAKRAYVVGAYLNQTGYSTRALDHFLTAVDKDPDNLWLKLRAARAALFLNDLPRARRLAEEVLKAEPQNHRAMQVLANIAMARGRRGEAVEWYGKIAEVMPRNIDALENLARLAYEDRDLEKTKEYCARILQVTSRNLNAILWHAEASALTGEIRHAADLYEQLVRYRPALISRLGEMGVRLVRQGRIDDALELYRRGLVMRPENEVLRMQWEALTREARGTEAVLESYEQLGRDFPLDLRLQELVAEYYRREGMQEKLVAKRLEMLDIDPRHISSLLSLAAVELEREDFPAAEAYFERAIKAGPQHASTYREIARVYLREKRTDRAEALLREALIIDPNDPDTQVALASLAIETGRVDDAERHLKRALDLAPANDQLLRLLGDFYREQGKLYEATQLYEQVLAVTPDDAGALLALASLHMEREDAAALDQMQERTAVLGRQLPTFFSEYGVVAMRHGEWDRARWGLERALEQYPANVALRQALATVYLHMREVQLAENTITSGRAHFPDTEEGRGEYQMTLLSLYVQGRQEEKAVELLRGLIADAPDDLGLRGLLVESLARLKRADAVQEELNEIVRRFGVAEPFQTRKMRANAYRTLGDYERALQILLPLRNEADRTEEVWFDLALTYGGKGDVENADRYYTRLIESTQPEGEGYYIHVNSLNNLAYLFAQKNVNLDRAEQLLTRALELNPGADYILDTMGWVRFRQGRYEDAERLLKRAEKLSLPDPEVYEHLAELYQTTGRTELALKYYRKALELDPHAEGIEEKVATLTGTSSAKTP
ncbi:MAG: tetratricopeptide repeat protein [Candidatus Sumerlaeia bacterium]|nr:tetratricopeptide repeat protein [Candidatus Sumerlaeia bacterium]